ncbi:hypothetical protein A2454_06860 [Candidatus Peribacteria bacterium RIFOXYC2_FULL_55_14]|nr:MAG: hypothetical protein UY85_C0023G0012 [Candidatus Peribacteria bacterium GW2011_GWB1_54_5]OGJ72091.1 MAG: hypothetical protein A2198_04450 [Candidatus Peribacteria bacterium RIFOXYA1_FULL_56_14]OGJ74105.1 MAG: hypothetical protein A2217_00470 [Candidatus Peribacteria bacterium RIFOXYA2_FULL_55_28]OGJ75536.1 MAG: hypothetical protein A2384_01430 [Candidatus Peribacteria bacterium RIFOXYB1_FULL_54_35]OGJ76288.1 MAG: hypothetical protein A2327_00440 [Candidatus Peribacteria bacterium RIFOXY
MKNKYTCKFVVKIFLIYIFPFLIISTLTFPFGERTVYKFDAHLSKTFSGNAIAVKGTFWVKPEKIEEIQWSSNISTSFHLGLRNEEPLHKLLNVPNDFFDQLTCFKNKTFYILESGNQLQDVDNIKLEITYQESKYLIEPNTEKCFDQGPPVLFYLAEIRYDFEKTKNDILEKGANNELSSKIEIRYTERPKYWSLLPFLYFTIYTLWWTLMLLWNKTHDTFFPKINNPNNKIPHSRSGMRMRNAAQQMK